MLLLAVGLSMPGAASAEDTGWVSPSTVLDSDAVDNPGNALADGGGYATFHTTAEHDFAIYAGFNFSIPAGSTITAITVRLDAWNEPEPYNFAYFSVAISPDGSDWYSAPSIHPALTETTYEIGNDLWGHAWTAGELNGNFQVHVQDSGFGYGYLDWVSVKVTYGQATGSQVPTLSEWGLAAFFLLLAAGAVAIMRRKMRGEA
ncbi:MAG TPA: IPTL-CTERM sorting domain-containing protein [Syntrophales bacterium]|nr:IPTL-CTERM sorting domain-containing protein [Syntrophales bacterium]HQB30377.1 IPTL-CTERM sorting domain-containing protein [Syntrophales bacterium]HQN78631.1 IPTL-CTERM sorting domain-containing protein [Syntrophales bacterium]